MIFEIFYQINFLIIIIVYCNKNIIIIFKTQFLKLSNYLYNYFIIFNKKYIFNFDNKYNEFLLFIIILYINDFDI